MSSIHSNRARFAIFSLFSLCLTIGCGESDSRIAISGVVICDGKPLDGASIAFLGNGESNLNTAVTDSQGRFNAKVTAGKNKVSVGKVDMTSLPPDTSDGTMPTASEMQSYNKKQPKKLIADRFENPKTSGIEVDIAKGNPSIEIKVSAK
jgi:hypothetical protein